MIYIGVCAVGIIAFALVGIVPDSEALHQLDEDIAQLNQKVQAQELLHPIYKELIKQVQQKTPAELPLPQNKNIAKKEIADINTLFASLADQSDVTFVSAVPDPVSYLEESGHLTMNVTYGGDFFNFRKLLMNVCKMPYLRSIERMQVTTDGDVKRIQLKLLLDQE